MIAPGAAVPSVTPPAVPVAAALGCRLWESLPALLAANLVFLAWCAPYGLLALLGFPGLALAVLPLTVGPGTVGLVTAVARIVRSERARPAALDLQRGRTGAVLAAALLLAWHAQLAALHAVMAHPESAAAIGLWAAQVALLVLGAMVAVHALPLVGLHGQGAREATRNGFVLAARHPGPTAAILVTAIAAGMLAWSLAGAPLIILPAAVAMLGVASTERLARHGGPTP